MEGMEVPERFNETQREHKDSKVWKISRWIIKSGNTEKWDTTHRQMGLKVYVLSSQSETPLGANSAQVVSLTQQRSSGYRVSSPVHHKTRKAIQVSLSWGCQVTPQNKTKPLCLFPSSIWNTRHLTTVENAGMLWSLFFHWSMTQHEIWYM